MSEFAIESVELRYNDAPFSASHTSNWVARVGGLPPYVRAIARGIMRSGHSESEAIQMAIGVLANWAAGGHTYGRKSHASPVTRAKAAEALAHWEAMKAAAHAKRDEDMIDLLVRRTSQGGQVGSGASPGTKPARKPTAKSSGAKASTAKTKNGKPVAGDHAAGHPFYGNQSVADPNQSAGIAVGGPGSSTKAGTAGVAGSGSGGGGGGGSGSGTSAASAAAAKQAAAAAAANAAKSAFATATSDLDAVTNAQDAVTSAAQRQKQAQASLATAQAEAKQDVSFAQAKETATTKGLQGASAVTAAQTSGTDKITAAQTEADNAAQALQAAQDRLSQAQQKLASRDEGHSIYLRFDWGRDLRGHAASLHATANKHTERVLETPKASRFGEVAEEHDRAAAAFHAVAEAHRVARDFPKAVAAVRVARTHETMAAMLRDAPRDNTLDQKEEASLNEARRKSIEAMDEYHNTRDVGEGNPPGSDPSGAATLLPVGPSSKQAKAVDDALAKGETDALHRFRGTDLDHCTQCGQPVTAAVHTGAAAVAQPIPPVPQQATMVRHAGPGHANVPSGHIKGSPARHAQAAKAQAAQHIAATEGPVEASMKSLFGEQRRSTLARLYGKRGKAMVKRCTDEVTIRAGGPNEPPEIPPEDTGAQPEDIPPSVDVGALFDSGYWASKTAEVLAPHIQTVSNLAQQAVSSQVHLDPMHDPTTSLGALNDVVTKRAQNAAQYISGATSKSLTDALQAGVANGEGVPAIAKRVNAVFDNADIVRAKRIAQTEVVGAYNESAHTFASQLPSDAIGSRRWLAHKDERTRPTHRRADGQEQPMGAPFYVGGYPMLYPGDNAAPPSETINCRCSVAYMPPGMAYGGIANAAAEYVAGLKAKPPAPVSPYVTSGVEP